MPFPPQPTTIITYGKRYSDGTWAKGSSSSAIALKQFPKTQDILPNSETLWNDFRNGVLRSDVDGYDGDSLPLSVDSNGEIHAFSRSFSDNSPPILSITGTSIILFCFFSRNC